MIGFSGDCTAKVEEFLNLIFIRIAAFDVALSFYLIFHIFALVSSSTSEFVAVQEVMFIFLRTR